MIRLASSTPVLREVSEVAAASAVSRDLIGTGATAVDGRLGGGLVRGALHEIYAALTADACAAAGFALLLALRGRGANPVVWLREDRGERHDGKLFAPGLADLGIDPQVVLIVTAPDTLSLLRAAAEIVGCSVVGTVIVEPWSKAPALDLTASRRLTLAAARSKVMTLIVRAGVDPAPSAAHTRWMVSTAPSTMLAANAPGPPAFDLSLLRHRGGIAGFDARVEWDRDRKTFRDAALSRGVPSVSAGGTRFEDARRIA